MAKHTILYGCGHIAAAEVEGNEYEQQEKLDYLKICGRCPACEKAYRSAHPSLQKAEGDACSSGFPARVPPCRKR